MYVHLMIGLLYAFPARVKLETISSYIFYLGTREQQPCYAVRSELC